jgi:hypothetical protein
MEDVMTGTVSALSIATVMVVLAGCVPAYKVSVPQTPDTPNFTLVDNRSDTEKQGASHNLITSCEYGITQLGENDIEPPRLQVLRAHLQSDKDLQNRLKGKSIEVYSFKVIRNWQVNLRRSVQKGKSGALASAMIAGCFAGPEIEGSYTIAENPNGLPSFTVLLSIGIDGRVYKIRHFETANTFDETRSMVDGNILPRVLSNAMIKLSQAIKSSS